MYSCVHADFEPKFIGAPNFRRAGCISSGSYLYGVAMCTLHGAERVMDKLMSDAARSPSVNTDARRRIYWINMREEPVVFIRGRPFVLRDERHIFTNLELTGINARRVEEMEEKLVQDVIAEAARYNGRIVLAKELDDGTVVNDWEDIGSGEGDVVTSRAGIESVAKKLGALLVYRRVPITDEKAPPTKVVSEVSRIASLACGGDAHGGLVFHCQMGRGRTTTAMVIGMLTLMANGGDPDGRTRAGDDEGGEDSDNDIREGETAEARCHRLCLFPSVRSLIRVLPHGVEAKRLLDRAVDVCGAMQNLRMCIGDCRERLNHESDERLKSAALMLAADYLERYCTLLTFASYTVIRRNAAREAGTDVVLDGTEDPNFSDWVLERKEVVNAMSRIHDDPLAALNPALEQSSALASDDDDEDIVRNGAVLRAHAMLKLDRFPGDQSKALPVLVPGAPNLRQPRPLNGCPKSRYPVYGVGTPDAAAICEVLRLASTSETISSSSGGGPEVRRVVWINMREEPYVYIHGQPFVLRDVSKPFANLEEYAGINASRLEDVERALARDVLLEAQANGGRVRTCVEGDGGSIDESAWQYVRGDEDVATPRTVMERAIMAASADLQTGSSQIMFAYHRVPITDGSHPRPTDFDVIASDFSAGGGGNDDGSTSGWEAEGATALVFSDQTGKGRTTTGMIIGCLLCSGRAAAVRVDPHVSGVVGADKRVVQEMDTANIDDDDDDDDDDGDDGECEAVRMAVRSLSRGQEVKKLLDEVVDACGAMVNVRMAVMSAQKLAASSSSPRVASSPPQKKIRSGKKENDNEDTNDIDDVGEQDNLGAVDAGKGITDEQRRIDSLNRAGELLSRYLHLLLFAHYSVHSLRSLYPPQPSPSRSMRSFSSWIASRNDLASLLADVSRNPAESLAVLSTASPSPHHSAVRARRGSLLAERTILKSYLPSSLPSVSPSPGSMPVVAGVGAVSFASLKLLCDDIAAGVSAATICIIDVREDPVVYVNGDACVLRDVDRPLVRYHHRNIDKNAIDTIERALKTEVLAESRVYNGRILVHESCPQPNSRENKRDPVQAFDENPLHENQSSADDTNATTDLRAVWKVASEHQYHLKSAGLLQNGATPLLGTRRGSRVEFVKTSREMALGLGESVSYYRIPFSRIRDVTPEDFDSVTSSILRSHGVNGDCGGGASSDVYTAVIFMSHMGFGSIGFAMAIAKSMFMSLERRRAASNSCNGSRAVEEPAAADSGPQESSVPDDTDENFLEIASVLMLLNHSKMSRARADSALKFSESCGNLLDDIRACRELLRTEKSGRTHGHGAGRFEHSRLEGFLKKYLKMYSLLIAFNSYLIETEVRVDVAATGGIIANHHAARGGFEEWFNRRKELGNWIAKNCGT